MALDLPRVAPQVPAGCGRDIAGPRHTDGVLVGVHPLSLAFLAVSLSAMGLGYVSVLGALKSRLREDADVTGRRSIVAGIASIGLIVAGAAVFRFGTPSVLVSISRFAGVYFASGGLVTLGLYFPWITAGRRGVDAPSAMTELQPAGTSLLNEIPHDHADERHSVRHDGLERR